jgi:hypothetical protein
MITRVDGLRKGLPESGIRSRQPRGCAEVPEPLAPALEQRLLLLDAGRPASRRRPGSIGGRVLDHCDHPRGHETPGADRMSGAGEFGHLDNASSSCYLNPSSCARRRDLEAPRAPSPRVDDDFHGVSDHTRNFSHTTQRSSSNHPGQQGSAVAHSGLDEDRLQMILHGVFREEHLRSDAASIGAHDQPAE